MYRINEIFYSLQGEGYFTGTPSVFVRFSGCNRKCCFCDTAHEQHTLMGLHDIINHVAQYPSKQIVLTGGEPAMQVTPELIAALHEHDYFIAIETNGSLPLPDGIDWITCSPKSQPWALDKVDELKVVFTGHENVENIASHFSTTHLFLQPCSSPDGTANTAETIRYILDHPHWRLSLQTHKLIGIR